MEYLNKLAVITGAASGIGRALAMHCATRGMHLALADIDDEALDQLALTLRAGGSTVMAAKVDVADAAAVQSFADQVHSHFGPASLLFNNAGIGGGGHCWELPLAQWQRTIAVNLFSVVYGIHSFVPAMLANGSGHIINTASIAGLMHVAGMSAYNTSKAAVVALSETLQGDLKNQGSDIGVSVLCPSFVNTNVFRSSRYRQDEMDARQLADTQAGEELAASFFSGAMTADEVAVQVFAAIAKKDFYIFTHAGSEERVTQRMGAIIRHQLPPFTGPENFPGL